METLGMECAIEEELSMPARLNVRISRKAHMTLMLHAAMWREKMSSIIERLINEHLTDYEVRYDGDTPTAIPGSGAEARS